MRPGANETLTSLILVIEWGYLNPQITDFGEDPTVITSTSAYTIPRMVAHFNQREMLTLVAGDTLARETVIPSGDLERLRDATLEDRYYLVVSAYDFEASLKNESRLMWRARMSAARHGVSMDDVVPALVAHGSPIFGREMPRPQIHPAVIREGTVELGTPAVVGGDAPAAVPSPSRE